MKQKTDNRKEVSTCLENLAFAEKLQKRTKEQEDGSIVSRFNNHPNTLSVEADPKNRKHEMVKAIMKLHPCADCPFRGRAAAKPHSLFARLHGWHKTWWPGWRIYQEELSARRSGSILREKIIIGKES